LHSLEEGGYDVLIVGTGVGGATCGYALAKAGHRVLFLEEGRDLSGAEALRGMPPEAAESYPGSSPNERREALIRSGRNPEPYQDLVAGDSFVPYIGYGTGGSSGLYGMVLERRHPHDFEGWPLSYADLAAWYTEAERLYEVRGSADPLGPAAAGCAEPAGPLSPANESLFAHLRGAGLHPYRLHLACRRVQGCGLCQGYLCPSMGACKNDARSVCLAPALGTGNARLLTGARVVRLEAAGRQVTAAIVDHAGPEMRIAAKLIVVAAGALSTPRILLRSGIANRTGLVGRRLMRHAIDLFVLTLAGRYRHAGESKELGLNDYYADNRDPLGNVQSFGIVPPLGYLRNQPGRNVWKLLGPAAAPVARLFAMAPIVASILEDKPSLDNRVDAGGGGARIHYRLPPNDVQRRRRLRGKVLRTFARFGPIRTEGAGERAGLGHVCGTVVFGDRPDTSVLDPHNRAHEVDNLFVVDASFFPTSGGVNPALTIAANALRVADYIHREVL
jgi:choline dehydrogenase-like flavoprotein